VRIDTEKLKYFLVDTGLLTLQRFKELRKDVGDDEKKLEERLIAEKLLTPENLLQIKGHIAGIPFINLEKAIVDPETLRLIPEETARSYGVVAYKRGPHSLEVAMSDPDNLQEIDFIRKKTGLEILPRLTSKESLKNVLRQYGESLQEEFSELVSQATKETSTQSLTVENEAKDGEEKQLSAKDLQAIAEKLPIIQVVDSLLHHAIVQKASDIHIEPFEEALVVRYRIDGILHDVMTLPHGVYSALIARLKVLANLKLDEHRLPQDGRFNIEEGEYKISVRVSIIPVMDGEKIVMRLLHEEEIGLTLESLGLEGNDLEIVKENIKKPNGMILITGPTGSGKTTTLYAIMDIINTPEVNIATIEDPIEYRMPRVNQTQVKPEIGLTFASGLRSLVRQDPDIIMVGEIRDNETASLAINAALTGHLVLSTLHTNSAAGALPRLLDMKVEPFLVASTANVIIAQRLVRKLTPDTKEPYMLDASQLKTLVSQYDTDRILATLIEKGLVKKGARWEDIQFFHPKPSKESPDGYKGRVGVYEVLPISEAIRKLITSQASSDQLQEQGIKEGMYTMLEDGFIKAVRGITTIEEIMRVTKE